MLLDDARDGGRATLLSEPSWIVEARTAAEVKPALEQLRGAGEVAGFIAYEAGLALEPKLSPLAYDANQDGPPLLWFGTFDRVQEVDAATWLLDPAGAWAGPAKPLIERVAYEGALARLHEHILAGDIYQANYTFAADVPVAGHPLAIYAALRARARMGHGALVYTGAHWILSFSPELFFTLDGRRVTTRPMKGTATRGATAEQDAANVAELAADPKQRSENLMIVDLLRNDLSRVCRAGTVQVPDLFTVETYPTVNLSLIHI